MNNAMMYAVFFEARMHSVNDQPVGKILELSDPDIIPAQNDEEAIKMAFDRAELIEYLKSLRLNGKESARKLMVRVKTVIRKGDMKDEVVFTPKYKGQFKHRA
jgi:hypothetical protein